MLNKWREALCGSVILASPAQKGATPELNAMSDILSCGGMYIPTNKRREPITARQSFMFHLPKGHYEVVVVEPPQKSQQQAGMGETVGGEGALLEATLQMTEGKFIK